jgi:transposase
MWLAQDQTPSYKTINRFRVNPNTDALIESLFIQFHSLYKKVFDLELTTSFEYCHEVISLFYDQKIQIEYMHINVNEIVETIPDSEFDEFRHHRGATSYHPKMMLKIIRILS